MSVPSLAVPPEFAALTIPPSLSGMLDRVRAVMATRQEFAHIRRYVRMIGMSVPFLMGIWVFGIGALRWYTRSFAFLGDTLSCGLIAAVLIACFFCFILGSSSLNNKNAKEAIWWGVGFVGLALLWAFLPIFPLIVATAVVVSLPILSHLENKNQNGVRQDIRFRDFQGLIEHIEAWNQVVQWANQLRLRIEHNLLEGSDRERAIQLLIDLRADERFVNDRIAYCTALAGQGEFGSRVTRDDMGAMLITDLSDRLDGFRERAKELRRFDREAIAAGEARKMAPI